MNLNTVYATKNKCYKAAKKMTPKGIMVHSTGANNPWLKRYVQPDDGKLGVNSNGNSFNEYQPGGKSVCVHAFIGKLKDGSIATYQIMPWDWIAWHSGKGSKGAAYNMGYIGFEICEDSLTDKAYFDKVYQEAVELCAYLCKKFGMTEKNIICHSEGFKKGIASNHGDVMHWFPKHGKSMDTFRAAVKAALNGGTTDTGVTAKTTQSAAQSVTSYRVRVTANALNIRKGAGTSFAIVGTIRDKGVYTITEEKGDWGKLASGAGWISLKYTTKV